MIFWSTTVFCLAVLVLLLAEAAGASSFAREADVVPGLPVAIVVLLATISAGGARILLASGAASFRTIDAVRIPICTSDAPDGLQMPGARLVKDEECAPVSG